MSIPVYSYVFDIFPQDIHQYQPILINPFWISHCLSFKPSLWRAHPAASPCHSNGIFSYQPPYQIQIPMMDKSAWADALECRLLLSISVLPGDCVLLGCMTLWGPFGGPAELQWLQSLKVNFRHWSPFRNPCSSGNAQFIPPRVSYTCCALHGERSHFRPLSLGMYGPFSAGVKSVWNGMVYGMYV